MPLDVTILLSKKSSSGRLGSRFRLHSLINTEASSEMSTAGSSTRARRASMARSGSSARAAQAMVASAQAWRSDGAIAWSQRWSGVASTRSRGRIICLACRFAGSEMGFPRLRLASSEKAIASASMEACHGPMSSPIWSSKVSTAMRIDCKILSRSAGLEARFWICARACDPSWESKA